MQHLDEGIIHAWIDGALSADEMARVAEHVRSCDACGALVAEARGLAAGASRIVAALDGVPGGVLPSTMSVGPRPATPVRRWLRATPFRAAIAAALVVAVGTMVSVRAHRGAIAPPAAESPRPQSPTVGTSANRPSPAAPATSVSTGIPAATVAKTAQTTRPEAPLTKMPEAPRSDVIAAKTPEAPRSDAAAAKTAQAMRTGAAAANTVQVARSEAIVAPRPVVLADSIAVAAGRPVADSVRPGLALTAMTTTASAQGQGPPLPGAIAPMPPLPGATAAAPPQITAAAGCYERVGPSIPASVDDSSSGHRVVPLRFSLTTSRAAGDGERYAVRAIDSAGRVGEMIPGAWWEVSPAGVRLAIDGDSASAVRLGILRPAVALGAVGGVSAGMAAAGGGAARGGGGGGGGGGAGGGSGGGGGGGGRGGRAVSMMVAPRMSARAISCGRTPPGFPDR
ncbi:MAG TPA: zf-HC2 domain-containing protein [Gemmatimonadaceae bacterium]|nr:zf-HC2 domain-containing protein [Gemmatimonadaceae bacterium]